MTEARTVSQALDVFVAALQALTGRRTGGSPAEMAEDRAALASLRRCAGRRLAECPAVYPLFYRLLPPALSGREDLEEHCFLIATLFALMPVWGAADLGTALAAVALADKQVVRSVERRLRALLACTADELPFHLRQTVRWLAPQALLIGEDAWLDWRRLLDDLRFWEHPQRIVQKRWASQYFRRVRAQATAGEVVASS